MPATIPAIGENEILDELVAAVTLKIMLFQNDATITDATVLADLTECDFDGYANQDLTFPSPAFQNPDNKGEIDPDRATFTKTSGATTNVVYGYAVYFDGGELFAVEKFLAPISMNSNGQSISIDLYMTASDDV